MPVRSTLPSADVRAAHSRRTLLRAGAWTVPVVTVAAAAPAFASSPEDVGAFTLTGVCDMAGFDGAGVVLTGGPSPLPLNTQIVIVGSGTSTIGTWSFPLGTTGATILKVGPLEWLVTLTSPLAAGGSLRVRSNLQTTISYTIDAGVTLPEGYVATGAKTTTTLVSSGGGTCTAS